MSKNDQMLFEYISGRALAAFSYETENKTLRPLMFSKFIFRIIAAQLIIPSSINWFKRYLKSLLPVALFLMRKFHIQLPNRIRIETSYNALSTKGNSRNKMGNI